MRFPGLIANVVLCLITPLAHPADEAAAQGHLTGQTAGSILQPPARSPVESFRRLLAMSPAERDQFLTNVPAAKRERILAKVEQYQMVPPDFRELRLRVTELRWYLLPLLKAPATNRTALLALVPEPYQQLIAARLQEWDIWPPQLRDEVLQYESSMANLLGRDLSGKTVVQPQMVVDDLAEKDRRELDRKLARWQAMPADEREQLYASFRHFFELSDEEQQKTLDALSQPERQVTEKAIGPIEKWPKSQQQQYMTALRRFVELSPAERQRFMKNAEHWQQMSPEERQAWRDLVQRLSGTPRLMTISAPLLPLPTAPRLPTAVRTN